MAQANFIDIGTQFVNYYYKTFDTDRSGLIALYRDTSMLTFEGAQVQGTAAIIDKLTKLPFQKVEHVVTQLDAHPSSAEGNILVLVSGALKVDEGQNALGFVQAFQLVPEAGSYYVYNDIFRLVYPH